MVSMVIMAGILIKFISSSKWFVKERERKENHFTSFILLLLLLLIDFQMDDLPLLLDKIKHINKLSNFFLLSQSFKVFFQLFLFCWIIFVVVVFFLENGGKTNKQTLKMKCFLLLLMLLLKLVSGVRVLLLNGCCHSFVRLVKCMWIDITIVGPMDQSILSIVC